MRQELALVLREQRSRGNSCGVSCTSSPSDGRAPLLEVDRELADLDHRARPRACAPERGPQAGEQLLHPERLRHVVVGARVERRDLLVLVADRREDDTGTALHVRSSRQTSMPFRSGSTRSRMTASGGAHRRRDERLLGRRCRLDLVARAAEVRLERAQDLRLVVDDEDLVATVMP